MSNELEENLRELIPLRPVHLEEREWYILSPICKKLNLKNITATVGYHISSEEIRKYLIRNANDKNVQGKDCNRQVILISELGLLQLLAGLRSPLVIEWRQKILQKYFGIKNRIPAPVSSQERSETVAQV